MSLQVLISTMNQKDYSLLEKMNICSDALVINQCRELNMEAFEYRGNQIEWFCFPETGIGKSRNNALLRASKEICLFADDDVIYCDNYSDVIEKEFAKHTDADLIIFNVISMNPKRQGYQIRRHQRIHFYNCLLLYCL